jgi:uncharacterized protein (DUF983 family)
MAKSRTRSGYKIEYPERVRLTPRGRTMIARRCAAAGEDKLFDRYVEFERRCWKW